MKTEQNVQQLGLYTSACCHVETLFMRGDSFSHCPQCSESCLWDLHEPVLTWQEFEELSSKLELMAA